MRSADKVLAKHELRDAGVPTPDFFAFTQTAFQRARRRRRAARDRGAPGLPDRRQAGRPGLARWASSSPQTAADVPGALVAAFSYDAKVLLERHVAGRDLAVSVLDGDALPVVEAIPKDEDAYDFESRYEIGATRVPLPGRAARRRQPSAPRSSRCEAWTGARPGAASPASTSCSTRRATSCGCWRPTRSRA